MEKNGTPDLQVNLLLVQGAGGLYSGDDEGGSKDGTLGDKVMQLMHTHSFSGNTGLFNTSHTHGFSASGSSSHSQQYIFY